MLWIAYDLWLTGDLFQPNKEARKWHHCCELLTIFDLQEIYSNITDALIDSILVVNCLRSLTYKRFIPTFCTPSVGWRLLWIAYDLWLTRDLFQHRALRPDDSTCCELLTIFDLQEIYSNICLEIRFWVRVVNCLRSLTYKRFIPTVRIREYLKAGCELLTIFDLQEIYSN